MKVYVHVGLWYLWIHGWFSAPSRKEDQAHDKSIKCSENFWVLFSLPVTWRWNLSGLPTWANPADAPRTKARVAWKVVLYFSNLASICSHALILLSPTRWIVMTGWRTSISLQPVFKHVWIMVPCCIQASVSTLCFKHAWIVDPCCAHA